MLHKVRMHDFAREILENLAQLCVLRSTHPEVLEGPLAVFATLDIDPNANSVLVRVVDEHVLVPARALAGPLTARIDTQAIRKYVFGSPKKLSQGR